MSIKNLIRERGIESVLHFTTNRGLVGVFAVKKLLSRSLLDKEQMLEYVLHVNAKRRPEAASDFDKEENWLNYVNLSISEINSRFLAVSRRWHNNVSVWWCILEFDAEILTHDGVFFTTTNNSYEYCIRRTGEEGLSNLFKERIRRKSNWYALRGCRPLNLPTCEQAEVLYPKYIELYQLRRVYVEEAEHHDIVGGWLMDYDFPKVEVQISTDKFRGCRN